jgi:hypothetical protein
MEKDCTMILTSTQLYHLRWWLSDWFSKWLELARSGMKMFLFLTLVSVCHAQILVTTTNTELWAMP